MGTTRAEQRECLCELESGGKRKREREKMKEIRVKEMRNERGSAGVQGSRSVNDRGNSIVRRRERESVCVCVRDRESERERERARARERDQHSTPHKELRV